MSQKTFTMESELTRPIFHAWHKKHIWHDNIKLCADWEWTWCTRAFNCSMSSHVICPHQLSMRRASKTPQWPPEQSLLVVFLGNVQRTNALEIWVRNRHCAKLCSACARLGVLWKSLITNRSVINQGICKALGKIFGINGCDINLLIVKMLKRMFSFPL